jgi:predicted phage terminase large subunit-like protein
LRERYLLELRDDFWKFCLYWDREFFESREFLKDVAEKMQRVADKQIRRLAISMPPRAGKSYIASLFSAWMLGRNPSGSIMRNSCTGRLYEKFSYDVRGIFKDDKFKRVFPVALSPDKKAVNGWSTEHSRQVGYFGAGIGGTILGFGADTLAILDDPIAGVEAALSETQLEKTWDWYTGEMMSRLEDECPEIHIATRWSRRDPIGRLEEIGAFDEVVKVAALDNNDRSFCEQVKTAEEYKRIREMTAPFIWQSEYQQQPVEVTGLLYPKDELRYFDIDALKGEGDAVAVVDVADRGSDYLACVVAKIIEQEAYIIDVVFTQEPIEVTEGLVAQALIKNDVTFCRIESNSGGRSFAMNVEKILRAQGKMTTIEQKPTVTNKQTRMMLRSGIVREFVRFRDDDKTDTYYKQYLQQLWSTFKDVGKNKHDDAADATTMLAELMESRSTNNWIITI